MKGGRKKNPVPAAPKKDAKETLSQKGAETNLKRKNKEDKTKKRQGRKEPKTNTKDPNKPKKPPTAFFVFLKEFRETYQAEHPGVKSVVVIGKAGGDKWKSLSETEKAPFFAKAAKKKAEYDKSILAYNQKEVAADESDKSKSEINDDEEGSGEELEEEEEEEAEE